MKTIDLNHLNVNISAFPTDVTFTCQDVVIIDTDSIFNRHVSSQ